MTMTVIAEKTSSSGNIEYTLERTEDKQIVLTVASVWTGHMERTSYYPHVWQWIAESLGSVAQAEAVQMVRMLLSTIKFETSRHAEFRSGSAQSAIDRAEAWLAQQS